MEILKIEPTHITPGIIFSPDENLFSISGMSAPEDVRALYYPVLDWMKKFIDEVVQGVYLISKNNIPVLFRIDLGYFNSSSAKFLFDILMELKKLPPEGVPVLIEWHYDEDDTDMKEAGEDISQLVEIKFNYVIKPSLK
jgi:hypothetical protein